MSHIRILSGRRVREVTLDGDDVIVKLVGHKKTLRMSKAEYDRRVRIVKKR